MYFFRCYQLKFLIYLIQNISHWAKFSLFVRVWISLWILENLKNLEISRGSQGRCYLHWRWWSLSLFTTLLFNLPSSLRVSNPKPWRKGNLLGNVSGNLASSRDTISLKFYRKHCDTLGCISIFRPKKPTFKPSDSLCTCILHLHFAPAFCTDVWTVLCT